MNDPLIDYNEIKDFLPITQNVRTAVITRFIKRRQNQVFDALGLFAIIGDLSPPLTRSNMPVCIT